MRPATDLYVALQARCPDLRSLLISGVQCDGADTIARHLVNTALQTGRKDVSLAGELHDASLDNIDGVPPTVPIQFDDPNTLLEVNRVKCLIQEASADRMLIFSTSDVRNFPHGSALAAAVDGVVLLVEAQKTTKTALSEVRDRLSTVGASLLGVLYCDRGLV